LTRNTYVLASPTGLCNSTNPDRPQFSRYPAAKLFSRAWDVVLPETVNLEYDILYDLDVIRSFLGTDFDCGARRGERWIRPKLRGSQMMRELAHAEGSKQVEEKLAKQVLLNKMWAAHGDLCGWAMAREDDVADDRITLANFLISMDEEQKKSVAEQQRSTLKSSTRDKA